MISCVGLFLSQNSHGSGNEPCIAQAVLDYIAQLERDEQNSTLSERDIVEDAETRLRNRLPNPRPIPTFSLLRSREDIRANPQAPTLFRSVSWRRATVTRDDERGTVHITGSVERLPAALGGTFFHFPEDEISTTNLSQEQFRHIAEGEPIAQGGLRSVSVLWGTSGERPRWLVKRPLRFDPATSLFDRNFELGLADGLNARGRQLRTGAVVTQAAFNALPHDTRYALAQLGVRSFQDYMSVIRRGLMPPLQNRGYRVARIISSQHDFNTLLPNSSRQRLAEAGIRDYAALLRTPLTITEMVEGGSQVGPYVADNEISFRNIQRYHNLYLAVQDIDQIDEHIALGINERSGEEYNRAHMERAIGNFDSGRLRLERDPLTRQMLTFNHRGIDRGASNLASNPRGSFSNIMFDRNGDIVLIDL